MKNFFTLIDVTMTFFYKFLQALEQIVRIWSRRLEPEPEPESEPESEPDSKPDPEPDPEPEPEP